MVEEMLSLIGRVVKDESGKEIGKIISFIIDSSGSIKEVLIENRNEELIRFPVERLKSVNEDVFLLSEVERRAERVCRDLPVLLKKRDVISLLFKNKEIPPDIYEGLSAELDKSINELTSEAQRLISEIEQHVQLQENFIKMLHLARTFLEMEHGVGNIKDDVFRQSLLSIFREMKCASYKKMNLLRVKDKITSVTFQQNVGLTLSERPDQKSVISVHITDK